MATVALISFLLSQSNRKGKVTERVILVEGTDKLAIAEVAER